MRRRHDEPCKTGSVARCWSAFRLSGPPFPRARGRFPETLPHLWKAGVDSRYEFNAHSLLADIAATLDRVAPPGQQVFGSRMVSTRAAARRTFAHGFICAATRRSPTVLPLAIHCTARTNSGALAGSERLRQSRRSAPSLVDQCGQLGMDLLGRNPAFAVAHRPSLLERSRERGDLGITLRNAALLRAAEAHKRLTPGIE